MKVRTAVGIVLVLILLSLCADALFSFLTSCYQIRNYAGAQQADAKECTAFGGPLISYGWRALVWIGHFLHTYDKEIVALFTAMLTLSTIALWWSTRQLWKSARDDFVSTHRPKIRFKHVWLMSDFAHNMPVVVRVQCVNSGTSDAVIFQYAIKFLTVARGTLLPIPDFPLRRTVDTKAISGVTVILPDEVYTLSQPDEVAIRTQGAGFYCVGMLHYRDRIGRTRTSAFCRKLVVPDGNAVISGRRFVKCDDPDYEYED